jgi:predicted RNase H-like HicB family nuclease
MSTVIESPPFKMTFCDPPLRGAGSGPLEGQLTRQERSVDVNSLVRPKIRDTSLRIGVVITPEEEGFSAYIPCLPGCISQGDDVEDATANITEALVGVLASYKDRGEGVPYLDEPEFDDEADVGELAFLFVDETSDG